MSKKKRKLLGQRLAAARIASGYTLEGVSRATSLSTSYVRAIEDGDDTHPSGPAGCFTDLTDGPWIGDMVKLTKLYGISIDSLVAREAVRE